MKLALNMVVALAAVACAAPVSAPQPGPQNSSQSASAVVEEFFRATADSNLTRMSELWGTSKGSARQTGEPKDYQKRVVIMNAYLKGVSVRALSEVDARNSDERLVSTELSHGGCRVTLPVTTVRTKNGWIVRSFDLNQAAEANRPCEGSRSSGNPGQ
ncbi:MAG: hypothetical protein ABJC19_04915 [Gemmatimonadota bacterium]